MDFTLLKAGPNDKGRRFDRVLKKLLPEHSLSSIYSLTRKGLVKLNGKKALPSAHLNENDSIEIAKFILEKNKSFQTEQKETCAPDIKIIFKNDDLIFVEKPYGTVVHGKCDSLEKGVIKIYGSEPHPHSLSFTPGPLHRLDGRTSGLIAFSWSLTGAKWFSENMKEHRIKKEYIAIVQGKMEGFQNWNDRIEKTNKNEKNAFRTVNAEIGESLSDSGKNAFTEAFPIAYGTYNRHEITLVKFIIHTGRTHQIRSQSSLHGFPLLGDTAYGAKEIKGNRKLFLHAKKLSFPKNDIALPESISSPLGKDFISFLETADCRTADLGL